MTLVILTIVMGVVFPILFGVRDWLYFKYILQRDPSLSFDGVPKPLIRQYFVEQCKKRG